MSFIRAMSF